MRFRTLLLELLILAFLAVFLLYPLAYVIPGSASDEEYQVRLLSWPETGEQKAQLVQLLFTESGSNFPQGLRQHLPLLVKSFPTSRKSDADKLAQKFQDTGAGVEVTRQRNWTGFYFQQALGFHVESSPQFPWLTLTAISPTTWECLRNSLVLACFTTLATTLLCLPLAYWFSRRRFAGQSILGGLLLVPLILPPFVGAIGLQRFLGRFGTINLWLMDQGWLDPGQPIDWLGQGGFSGVVLMQVLHLYPILHLNLAAAWANVDPTLEDAARNLGASEWRVFRTVTFPLLLPGYFAGASLVFVAAFTDLGTPLVFNYLQVVPVRIFFEVSDPQRTNAVAYALVVITLVVTAVLFFTARWLVSRRAYIGGGKGAVASAVPWASRRGTVLIYAVVLGVTLLAAVPHVGVILTAFAERWTFTPLPESYTLSHLHDVWSNPVAASSIRNSLIYSAASTVLDILLGGSIAWLAARRPGWLASVLEGLAMLPLALPGLVLAFGYLTCYAGWIPWLKANLPHQFAGLADFFDPSKNPTFLLIIAYAVRRLPYLTRSALAGLQQIAPVLEEAAENLGASRWQVLRTVTFPLIAANLVAGCVLTFAFALLEVSDSLMLAREERYFPITRAILGLLMRPDDGDLIASALGVFAMLLLGCSLLAAGIALGRRMGELFRV
jgi:iron(III) transport system permease protein